MRALAVSAMLGVLAAACASRSSAGRAGQRQNILLVTIDTFRADRLGAGIAPTLDRLAENGVRFTAARAAVPLTLPSHATIMTGVLPPVHGVRENGVDRLDGERPTIARLLQRSSYRTAAFVGAFVLDRRFGLAEGFDVYDDRIPRDPEATERLEAERPASAVVDRALAWLDEYAAHPAPGTQHPAPSTQHPAPFFMWIHLYDPHAPYRPPADFVRPGSGPPSATRRYEGEVAYADSQIARVFARLKERGMFDRTLIIVAGDHGEALGDHGEGTHGMLLYESTLRVPLVVAAPGVPAATRNEAVSLVDIAPTVLRAAGIEPPAVMSGRDLLHGAAEGATDASRLYAESEYPRAAGWSTVQALIDGRWKAIRAGRETELYDLQNDPGETRNVAGAQQATAAAMVARIDALRARSSSSTQRSMSPEVQQRLRALGYIGSTSQAAPAPGAPNPSSTIAAWDAFEDALAALTLPARGGEADDARVRALAVVARLARDHPEAAVFRSTYARGLKDAGRIREALEEYRQAARRWPTDPTLLHDLAVAARDEASRARGAEAARLRRESADAERAALALDPRLAVAHNGLGLLAVDEARDADAVREFEQAAALDPNNASYWVNAGNARRTARDAPGAERAYRQAMDIDAANLDAANGLGALLVETGRPADAVAWFERALSGAPDFVEARLNLGIALEQSGDTRRAAEAYRRVLAAPGRHPREKDAAATLLAALGRRR